MSTRARRLIQIQEDVPVLQIVTVVIVFFIGAVTLNGFANPTSIKAMLILAAFLGLAGAGSTLVILIGGLDLSVPALIAFGNIVMPELVGSKGWPFPLAVLIVLVLAGAVGATNGYLSQRLEIQPLIVSLATGAIVIGGVVVWTGGVSTGQAPTWLSEAVSPIGSTWSVPVPAILFLWLGVAVAAWVMLSRTVVGRRLYLTGSNPVAARLSGVSTTRIWMFAFAASAVLSAFTGILLAGFSGAGSPGIGDPYLFQGLAAVVVGGTSIMGAKGDYWRTVLGALLLTEVTTLLVGYGYSSALQQVVFGLIIFVVVAGYGRDRSMRDYI